MEPMSSGAAAFIKFYGMFIIIGLAILLVATVVVMMRMPRSPQEWVTGLICTLVSSLAGGAFLIIRFGLQEWATDVWGMIALGGFFFACGIPGWAIVRWVFNFIERREGSTIVDIFREFKGEWKKGDEKDE